MSVTAAPAPADVEAIERATVAAVAPVGREELDGWLLPFDASTVGRAKSAVPLRHAGRDPAIVAAIEARYAAQDLPAWFRVADVPALAAVRDELARRGYRPGRPTLVQMAASETVRRVSTQAPAECSATPDRSWAGLYLGEGLDPVDGANRVRILSRTPGAVYACMREGGDAVAGGVGAFDFGWASVHGMRTQLARRGQGLAARVLATLAGVALERGMQRMFLQVEAENAAALALYRRAGFVTAWEYRYWQQP